MEEPRFKNGDIVTIKIKYRIEMNDEIYGELQKANFTGKVIYSLIYSDIMETTISAYKTMFFIEKQQLILTLREELLELNKTARIGYGFK